MTVLDARHTDRHEVSIRSTSAHRRRPGKACSRPASASAYVRSDRARDACRSRSSPSRPTPPTGAGQRLPRGLAEDRRRAAAERRPVYDDDGGRRRRARRDPRYPRVVVTRRRHRPVQLDPDPRSDPTASWVPVGDGPPHRALFARSAPARARHGHGRGQEPPAYPPMAASTSITSPIFARPRSRLSRFSTSAAGPTTSVPVPGRDLA